MKRLLWKLCSGDAAVKRTIKQQRLRAKCLSLLLMDELAGWIDTYFTPRNLGGRL